MQTQRQLPILVRSIVIVYHAPEFEIVFANSFEFSDFCVTNLQNLQRFHVEVVLEGEVNINFAGAYEKLLQLDVLEFLMEDEVGAELGDVKLQILLGENCRFALIINNRHQLAINFTLLS
jgi:hypothetical protein